MPDVLVPGPRLDGGPRLWSPRGRRSAWWWLLPLLAALLLTLLWWGCSSRSAQPTVLRRYVLAGPRGPA